MRQYKISEHSSHQNSSNKSSGILDKIDVASDLASSLAIPDVKLEQGNTVIEAQSPLDSEEKVHLNTSEDNSVDEFHQVKNVLRYPKRGISSKKYEDSVVFDEDVILRELHSRVKNLFNHISGHHDCERREATAFSLM